jgi:hypothetical protein
MQNAHTEFLKQDGKPKGNKILVYTKGIGDFYRHKDDPTFSSKKEAQAFYAKYESLDSMLWSDRWYQKGQIYRRLYPTTRKACKALIARLNPPSLLP